ncbi:hypothetical protein PsYK624_067320 [Phanerochaete sordida]|uniref:Uncharacterized protein n=1 Tax=Phanerochaete sordida TaxID=48140 RepID=A0A9P3G797_9APHY|nr:hypothetical protein PsYK624_067320 [Phanerochaete sordida]
MDCRYTYILVLLEAVDVSLIAWRTTNVSFILVRLPLGTLYQNMILVNLNARGFRCDFGWHAHVIEVGSLRTDSEEIMHEPDGDHRTIRSLIYYQYACQA